jgi:hypothetical protein
LPRAADGGASGVSAMPPAEPAAHDISVKIMAATTIPQRTTCLAAAPAWGHGAFPAVNIAGWRSGALLGRVYSNTPSFTRKHQGSGDRCRSLRSVVAGLAEAGPGSATPATSFAPSRAKPRFACLATVTSLGLASRKPAARRHLAKAEKAIR